MSTNYGARPGLEVQEPRTMSAEQERALFMTMAQGHPLLGERFGGSWAVTATAIKRELDAERAAHAAERERHAAEKLAHARTLAALIGARQWLVLYDSADEDGERQLAADLNAVDQALAQARGSQVKP